ncbi:phosphocholine-specific phospholipase C [uncultured Chitinophaga sp.]|jgi:phospholipase C, phosphocholine-specific, Pseudomonas-type|uniref:phosphocholine-specific phospholipase C n=1 Tax=uncultured Chitinophaga sp. TaxID=339340 RepID=UPI002621009D|nr:phospholipase C, phosphocholine-specific [uncultured Chitinophaga sp.]
MDSRREFLKKAALLSGAAGFATLPASVQRALAIDPAPGTTYLDAEHIVFLMQENRSFDHCYGALQGVRGFNDPRAIRLPNKNSVWLQTNAAGETYAPFRLNMKETRVTWMGSLPHSWSNQVDARNNGKYDKWLDAKPSGHPEYAKMPLTMGYYTRRDIPFYYALADAFTVCDQHFCSSLTGTTPNRLYFWTGTIRAQQNENSPALVWNEEADYTNMASWKTFPERLEEQGVSWRIYQNDISVEGGFTGEEDSWLANYGDNPIEYFSQFNVKLSERYLNYLDKAAAKLPAEIAALEKQVAAAAADKAEALKKSLRRKKDELARVKKDQQLYTREKYEKLSPQMKSLHEKAFTINKKDPEFGKLTTLQYQDGNTPRKVTIPKGDILYQFREDVKNGSLPAVSWLVAPENFSDHPSSAWYGAWYVSEVMDILTSNPEVWKKTIFVLTYDENDGYFDHVPPFVAPNPRDKNSGKVSDGIDAGVEFVSRQQEQQRTWISEDHKRESPIGLGYRVPLVIASPWSRGGWVNSQVFDHTSSLQFLEEFLQHKTGKSIQETNITAWRRTVCGNLSSVFRPYNGEKIKQPAFVEKNAFIESVHKAKFKGVPDGYKKLSDAEIALINRNPAATPLMPSQEKGIRPSNALPYELYVNGQLKNNSFEISFAAGNKTFGKKAAGAPFTVYAPDSWKGSDNTVWSYAVSAGDQLQDTWQLSNFEGGQYHLQVHGPNGFFREFKGSGKDPQVGVSCMYAPAAAQQLLLKLVNNSKAALTIEITDNSYKTGSRTQVLNAGASKDVLLDLSKSFGWYDHSVKVKGADGFEQRFAGRVETGKSSFTDPLMGRV